MSSRERMRARTSSAAEDDGRLQPRDLDDAEQRGEGADDDERDDGQQQRARLEQERRLADRQHQESEQRGEAEAHAVADDPDGEGLEQEHAREQPSAGAHRLERAEMAEVLEHEGVEGLPRDGDADDEPEEDGREERDGDAGGLPDVVHRHLGELVAGERSHPGLALQISL